MSIPSELFHIQKIHLKDQKLFPFHLYVYNPQSESYSPFLFANSPLTDDAEKFISFIETKGGCLAVDKKQKRTFLHAIELNEEDIPSLRKRELTELEKKRLEKINSRERDNTDLSEDAEKETKIYDLKDGLKNCIESNNFLPMIEACKKEVEIFELNISHTVSLAAFLAENLLTEDNFTNRVVAVSYFLAKNLDMREQETLADIICASFFAHLGYTQIDYSLSHMAENDLSEQNKNKVKKHPGYSHHLLLKSGVEISDRCKNIIFQHHERYDGSGYPRQKHSEFIDILALLLGAVTHIFEYSSGKVTGTPIPIYSVINRIKNKTFSAGLEFEFGDKILNNITTLVNLENIGEGA